MAWRLEVEWCGRTLWWDSVPAYLSETWEIWGDSPGVRSEAFAVVPEIDIAAQVANGAHLEGAVGRLYLDGVLHLVGLLDSPRFGGAGHPLEFSLREAPWADDGGEIPGQFVIGLQVAPDVAETNTDLIMARRTSEYLGHFFPGLMSYSGVDAYASPESRDEGRIYVVVFGAPGAADQRPGSPALFVNTTPGSETLLVAGHICTPGNVRIFGPNVAGTGIANALVPVTNTSDGFGRRVCTANISAFGLTFDLGATDKDWYACWNSTAVALPGGAGDVLELLLRHSTLRIDWPRVLSLRPALNRYQLDGYIDEVVTPWRWISDQLLPILPLAPVVGPDGLYFGLWSGDQPAVDQFVAGPEFVPDPGLKYASMEPVNSLSLRYRYDPDVDEATAVAVCTPDSSPYAEISREVYGLRTETIETEIVADAATAGRIAQDLVRLRALAPILVSGRALRSRYDARRCGDLVRVTAPALSLSDRLGFVTAIGRDGGPMMDIEIALLPDPFRRRA